MAIEGRHCKLDLLIVLSSLAAEGCPQLALQLAAYWSQKGLTVVLLCLNEQSADMMPEFEALGIPIHIFSLGRGLSRYRRLFWLSYRICRRLRPQAVLSFPLGWHAIIALGARLAGVRYVCAHVGNLPPVWTGIAFAKFKILVQLGRPTTTRLICCSEHIRVATIHDFWLRVDETCTIYNACDLERFGAQPRAEVIHHPARIGVVGRLDANRDYSSLIQAVGLLREQRLHVEIWMIGDGEGRRDLQALVSDLKLSDQVIFLGVRRDIPALLAELDVFIWPALELEGFGIALAEAMAAGVPIVATDVGACREVLDSGRCGLLVEPGSPEALAAGICKVLADPAGAQLRAAAARERAFKVFSVAAMAQAYGHELRLPPNIL